MINLKKTVVALGLLLAMVSVSAAKDIQGGADHPVFPRIANTKLIGYDRNDYDTAEFLKLSENKEQTKEVLPGKRTQLIYLADRSISAASISNNYQEAFSKIGNVTEIYSCRGRQCNKNFGRDLVWGGAQKIETNNEFIDVFYSSSLFYQEQTYLYAKIESEGAIYSVSVYSATRRDYQANRTQMSVGESFIHVQILEHKPFESDLAFVTAEEIETKLAKVGHAALYGLFFDSGKDSLKEESKGALIEISKLMKSAPGMLFYVVGHTDNEGSIASNEDLSKRRATSVITRLSEHYGIKRDRLTAIGAGLAAPVASNDTSEGRALNRRVELVKR